jgi:capsular polysaccharide biosynthesis protein
VTLPNLVRAVVRRWYITVPGLLLSLAIAGITFTLIPPQYTSSGVAVLVQPKEPGSNTYNPLLNFNSSLNTTALIMQQALNAPEAAIELGLTPGEDSFTVKNIDSVGGGSGQPFISVAAQSSIPAKSAEIVTNVLDRARGELVARQSGLHVSSQNVIRLDNVVDATAPKVVPGVPLAVAGVALILGLAVTIFAACALDRWIVARVMRRRSAVHASRVATMSLFQYPESSQVDDELPVTPRGAG